MNTNTWRRATETVMWVAVGLALAGCGSVSDLQLRDSSLAGSAGSPLIGYSRVVVEPPAIETASESERVAATNGAEYFAAKIGEELRAAGVAMTVEPAPADRSAMTRDANTLIIGGKITRFQEGDPTLRLMIGMGAGSSEFRALITLRDAATSREIGVIEIDRHSWPLGGVIAASQTPRGFMDDAARHIARDIQQAVRSGATADIARAGDHD